MAALGLVSSKDIAERVDLGSSPLECHCAVCLHRKSCSQLEQWGAGNKKARTKTSLEFPSLQAHMILDL